MDGHQEKRVLAVGLVRKAARLFDAAGDTNGATALGATIDAILDTHPLTGPEIDPDLAAIVAAAPLTDAV
jgi:hypothetical protein